MKNTAIVALVVILVWFGMTIVRLENQRYAMELGICGNFDPGHPQSLVARAKCLETVQTRISAVYNLVYGLKIL